MSHELRTPLNAILGFGQLLHRELDASEYSDSVGHILKAGRHLLDLINDVLEIAKIEANEMSLSMEPVPLGTTIQEVLLMMEPIALGARVELLTHSSHSSVWVHADRLRLRQILLNLISNGIKYNHPKGHVWVDYTETDTEAVITVRDDGPGIAVELQSRLFTPFDRLGAEIGGIEGTGIGLSLSRALVELMSGRISVQSTSGLGSSFIISLPIDATVTAAVPHAPAPEPSGETLDGPITSATLLYIEDNLLNVHLVESLLRLRPGWRLLHASLGQLGMDMAKAHQPDFVILDLHLPDLAGRAMLKNDPATSTIPVLVLTADASVNQRSLLDSHGADFFMTKPLDLDEFLAVLDTHIMKVSQGA
jgi:CheY-like chemotaxis protein